MGQKEVRRELVEEYERGGVSFRELTRKYGISTSTIHRWVKQAEAAGGIEELESRDRSRRLTAKQKKPFDRRSLPADVRQLQKELEEARLHNELLEAMIDIAEGQLGVDIRKKAGARQR